MINHENEAGYHEVFCWSVYRDGKRFYARNGKPFHFWIKDK